MKTIDATSSTRDSRWPRWLLCAVTLLLLLPLAAVTTHAQYLTIDNGNSYTFPAGNYTYVNVYAGYNADGKITQSTGTSVTDTNQYAGLFSTGTYTLNGGTNTVGNELGIGYYAGSNGTYNLYGGALKNTSDEYVGASGTGTLNQTGGTNNANALLIGAGATTGNGTYNLSGTGALSASSEFIGYGGTGAFTQSGGTNTTGSPVYLGYLGGGAGTYTLGGGTLTAPSVVRGGGSATFYFKGGTLQASADSTTFMQGLTHAYVQSGGAVIDTNGHAVTVAQPLVHDPALGSSSDGGLTKNGTGTLTLSGASTYTGGTSVIAGTLAIASGGSIGTISAGVIVDGSNLNAPTVTLATGGMLTAFNEFVGAGFSGSFVQSGGTNTVNNSLFVGYGNGSGGSGSYTLSGTGALTASAEYIGYIGSGGSFVQSGGTNTVGAALALGAYGGNGTYTLSGGTLQTPSVGAGSSGTSTFNFNGGTLQASTDNTAFVSGLTNANVQAGGAVIDSNGHNITINQALVHDSALGATPDGGLNKMGTGTLILGGLNTYTGTTTVTGGVLEVARDRALGSGNVIVLASAAHLTLDAGILDAIDNAARLTLAGGGTPGVADVGYLQLNGNVEIVGSLMLGGTLYTSGVFTAAQYPDYISGLGSIVVTGVPEPGTWTLLALGGAGLSWRAFRRRAHPRVSSHPSKLS